MKQTPETENKVQSSKENRVHVLFSDMLGTERTLPLLVRSLQMRTTHFHYAKELTHALGTVDVAAVLRSRIGGTNSAIQTILGFRHLFLSSGGRLFFFRFIEDVYDLGVFRLLHWFVVFRIVPSEKHRSESTLGGFPFHIQFSFVNLLQELLKSKDV